MCPVTGINGKNSNKAEGTIFLMTILTRKSENARKIMKIQNYNANNQPTCDHDK